LHAHRDGPVSGQLDRAGVVEPDLMRIPVGPSHDEGTLE
jgi:hypothetical protein